MITLGRSFCVALTKIYRETNTPHSKRDGTLGYPNISPPLIAHTKKQQTTQIYHNFLLLYKKKEVIGLHIRPTSMVTDTSSRQTFTRTVTPTLKT